MVCGGFACSKNCLCALNLLYTLVSLLLIGIAAWGIGFGLISSLRVVGVVIAVGIFLFLIALVGLIGAVKHHQVLLFFYMIILLLVFIVQFSVSCACLALNQEQQGQLLEVGWNNTASARNDIQRNLNCCGFRSFNPNDTCLASCVKSSHPCSLCAPIIGKYAGEVLRFVGGIGLFFSFTEVCTNNSLSFDFCHKDLCFIWQEGMGFYLSMAPNLRNVSISILTENQYCNQRSPGLKSEDLTDLALILYRVRCLIIKLCKI
ncbi:tetraspanin-13 isoform X1 [Ursus arctos]|uniref:tetraspanin-13 isoform X1 n=1 Tax=Ursus arctos TaxID=9644 RepID=UPI002549624F|nr:tetraspanin-13 isoform X1 [Ursus arctos]